MAFNLLCRCTTGEFYPTVPFVFKDQTTYRFNNPSISKRIGTNSGLTPMNSEFSGSNASTQIGLTNKNWLFSYTYAKMLMNLSPEGNNDLPLIYFNGKNLQNIYNSRIDYNWFITSKYAINFSGRQFVRSGTYTWEKVIDSPEYRTEFIAFPRVEVNDKMRINMFSLGPKIPITETLEIEPYFQYRSVNYYLNVFPSLGATTVGNGFIPTNPDDILKAWTYQNLGTAYNFNLYSPKVLNFGNVGLKILYKPVPFIILRGDIRRNYVLAAWEIRGLLTFMFSKYFGITIGGVYAQKEVNPMIMKAWEIGPMIVYSF
ncbi:MAG TPA: hypothetical protein PK079_12370 [Leptospiraceae bacterium]|nr:hypothetical protein [Leptospiraceae bacterium]HMW05863.1 hypothetical protein [Leptospiraceae bacterium]HMX33201.1 hypothetical protein [Leptospiraceae bacterium]HMY33649.1 hypothetical protein [Leptospiraceae bacterium]HNE09936.1 hypothetical protein [Leptospiraceae bacterium]